MRCSSQSSRERLADLVKVFKDGGQVIIILGGQELIWIRCRYYQHVECRLDSRPHQKTNFDRRE